MKKKNYGKLLLASAVSVVLCAFMLAGTTWAWFTDSVTSAGNKIQAGTLKISAASAAVDPEASEKPFTVAGFNGDAAFGFGAAQNLETAGPMISAQNWEPGKSDAKLLSVKNAGTLAAKIKIRFAVTDGGLADALWFDFVQVSADNEVTGTFTRRPMSTLAAFAESIEIPLAGQNDEVRFLFLFGMNTDAGNAYQNTSFEASVTILAKQMSAEADGFGDPDYDKDAEYPVFDSEELVQKLETALPGDTVVLSSGSFELASVTEGVTLAGKGVDATVVKVTPTTAGEKMTGLVVNQADFTLRNMTVQGDSSITGEEYYGVLDIRQGGATLDNITVKSVPSNASAVVIKKGVDAGESVTIKNCVLGSRYNFKTINIVDGVNGTVNILDTEITGTYTFNVNSASSQELIVNVAGSKLHGWTSYGDIKAAYFTDTEFSKGESNYDFLRPYADTFLKNCTFDEAFRMGAGKLTTERKYTITIENCYKNGTRITAENVQALLLDATEKDEFTAYTTIIVDGVTVTLNW